MKFNSIQLNGYQFNNIKINVYFLWPIFYRLFTDFFFYSLNFESLVVFCKFCVADALLHYLSCGDSLLFPCALICAPSADSEEVCSQGAVINQGVGGIKGRYYA